ncbi:MAG: ferredoxin-thioredoxin reductase catalytic domain-containing protein [Thermoplasmatota archaeon]|jgi:ferredoxin-thioredoxin reductase catalytic subunit/rubredoxin
MNIIEEEIEKLHKKLDKDAESGGYHLNKDTDFVRDLIKGLLINEKRYGYQACPCRLASGVKSEDLDIICPCDYRDTDLNEYGTCYCGLYVSQEVIDGKRRLTSIPERRLPKQEKEKINQKRIKLKINALSKPVWRCKVCGYLCARDEPPEICPICKVKKDRFERFI